MPEHDSDRIVRQWNRQIDNELRHNTAHDSGGPWRGVVWGVLWLLWLGLIFALVVRVNPLR